MTAGTDRGPGRATGLELAQVHSPGARALFWGLWEQRKRKLETRTPWETQEAGGPPCTVGGSWWGGVDEHLSPAALHK